MASVQRLQHRGPPGGPSLPAEGPPGRDSVSENAAQPRNVGDGADGRADSPGVTTREALGELFCGVAHLRIGAEDALNVATQIMACVGPTGFSTAGLGDGAMKVLCAMPPEAWSLLAAHARQGGMPISNVELVLADGLPPEIVSGLAVLAELRTLSFATSPLQPKIDLRPLTQLDSVMLLGDLEAPVLVGIPQGLQVLYNGAGNAASQASWVGFVDELGTLHRAALAPPNPMRDVARDQGPAPLAPSHAALMPLQPDTTRDALCAQLAGIPQAQELPIEELSGMAQRMMLCFTPSGFSTSSLRVQDKAMLSVMPPAAWSLLAGHARQLGTSPAHADLDLVAGLPASVVNGLAEFPLLETLAFTPSSQEAIDLRPLPNMKMALISSDLRVALQVRTSPSLQVLHNGARDLSLDEPSVVYYQSGSDRTKKVRTLDFKRSEPRQAGPPGAEARRQKAIGDLIVESNGLQRAYNLADPVIDDYINRVMGQPDLDTDDKIGLLSFAHHPERVKPWQGCCRTSVT